MPIKFTKEDDTLITCVKLYGKKWKRIMKENPNLFQNFINIMLKDRYRVISKINVKRYSQIEYEDKNIEKQREKENVNIEILKQRYKENVLLLKKRLFEDISSLN